MLFVCQFEQTNSKSDPLYLLQPNLSQVKVGLTTKRQHTFHVWNFLISKHYISSQYKFKRVIQMLDVLSNLWSAWHSFICTNCILIKIAGKSHKLARPVVDHWDQMRNAKRGSVSTLEDFLGTTSRPFVIPGTLLRTIFWPFGDWSLCDSFVITLWLI